MKVIVAENCRLMGELAARQAAEVINSAVKEHGAARIVLSTGASQFDTLSALVRQNVDWSKVEMFHLDEYVDLPETHPAINQSRTGLSIYPSDGTAWKRWLEVRGYWREGWRE